MKIRKSIRIVLAACLIMLGSAFADFSASSTQYDPELAQLALRIAEMCYKPSSQASYLSLKDYRKVGFYHASRQAGDTSHTAAYGIYERTADNGRTEVIIAIRGTGSGEWELNLDLMPSGDYDLPYAENFTLAAEEILSARQDYLDYLASPAFLVTGHSRGAAVANILGARLSDRFGEENVFVYTFASPGTVRGDFPEYSNIFNLINPADVITYLPLQQWGFRRYGTDVELIPEDASTAEYARKLIRVMAELAPEVRDGYEVRHALTHPGTAADGEEGMTAAEFVLMLFDGNLMAGAGSPDTLPEFARAENDFTPVFRVLQEITANGGNWISDMHTPATYREWMPGT